MTKTLKKVTDLHDVEVFIDKARPASLVLFNHIAAPKHVEFADWSELTPVQARLLKKISA